MKYFFFGSKWKFEVFNLNIFGKCFKRFKVIEYGDCFLFFVVNNSFYLDKVIQFNFFLFGELVMI